ncbi:MAG: biopolymer transporter ExbD [Verrucomicrobiota bacterium]
MSFYQKRRARPTIPIVSLIDILTILLIFFIVTMTWKEEIALVQLELPQSSGGSGPVATAGGRLLMALTAEGEILFQGETLAIAELPARLESLAGREVQVELKADKQVTLETLVLLEETLRAAGIDVKDLGTRVELPGAGS